MSATSGCKAPYGPYAENLQHVSHAITIKGSTIPHRVTTHPGEVLAEEFLKPLRLSVNPLAIALRVPATRIGAIVKGERAVTAETALRLARFFGTSADFFGHADALTEVSHCGRSGCVRINVCPRLYTVDAIDPLTVAIHTVQGPIDIRRN